MAIEVEELEATAVQIATMTRAMQDCDAEIAWTSEALSWIAATVRGVGRIEP
jgi:hypothetical protein